VADNHLKITPHFYNVRKIERAVAHVRIGFSDMVFRLSRSSLLFMFCGKRTPEIEHVNNRPIRKSLTRDLRYPCFQNCVLIQFPTKSHNVFLLGEPPADFNPVPIWEYDSHGVGINHIALSPSWLDAAFSME
jgi:hypothetical protein